MLDFRAVRALNANGKPVARTYGAEVEVGAFTRATRGTIIDRDGRIVPVTHSVPRIGMFDGRAALIIEPSATQICSQPQTPASWSDFGTPIITTGRTDPWGTSAAIIVEDDSDSAREGKFIAVAFTGDGTKSALFAVRPGTVTALSLAVRDVTASNTDRHRVLATWAAGPLAAPTLTTESGSGFIDTPYSALDPDGNLWWLIGFTASGVVAANDNQLYVVAGAASGGASLVGTFHLAGANAWNADRTYSWQQTSGHVRNADTVRWPILKRVPGDCTLYAAGFPLSAYNVTGGDFSTGRILHIGTSGTGWKLQLRHSPTQNGGAISGLLQGPGGSAEQATSTPIPSPFLQRRKWTEFNLRVRTGSDGATSGTVAQLGQELSLGFSTGNVTTPPKEWDTGEMLIRGGIDCYGWAFTHIGFCAGLKPIAEMRELMGVA